MATNQIRSVGELYKLTQNQIQSDDNQLTDFNQGSILDILTGAMAQLVAEAQRNDMDLFAKAFVETANGPVNPGDTDDLQRRLVDLYGSQFSRPQAVPAVGNVTFTRPKASAGVVDIPAGTIIKTAPDSSGQSVRYATTIDTIMASISINAPVQAVLAGSAGNVASGNLNIIESTLTDLSISAVNMLATSGGTDILDDSDYREFARNLLVSLRGSTLAAIAASALTVPGVVQAVPVEAIQTVVQVNPATLATLGSPFSISRNYLYIADVNGQSSAALIAQVQAAIEPVRAGGVKVTVIGASAVIQNVQLNLILNAAGPNYASLANDASPILNSMSAYISALPIGQGFSRIAARAAILATWGTAGSGDLTDLQIVSPTGDVTIQSSQTLIPGTMSHT